MVNSSNFSEVQMLPWDYKDDQIEVAVSGQAFRLIV
jgi:hypothetical protein